MLLRRLLLAAPVLAWSVRPLRARAEPPPPRMSDKMHRDMSRNELHAALQQQTHAYEAVHVRTMRGNLLAWRPIAAYGNVVASMNDELLAELDFIRVMYDDVPPTPQRMVLITRSIARAMQCTRSAQERDLCLTLVTYFGV